MYSLVVSDKTTCFLALDAMELDGDDDLSVFPVPVVPLQLVVVVVFSLVVVFDEDVLLAESKPEVY